MIYDKITKNQSFVQCCKKVCFLLCVLVLVFCKTSEVFAQDLSNNWEYTYTNFGDIYNKDIEAVASSIYANINSQYGESNKKLWNDLINNRYFERSYFYIPATDISDRFIVYIYAPTTNITQGIMTYYKFENFPCYSNLTYLFKLEISKAGINGSGNSMHLYSDSGIFNLPVIFYGFSTNLLVTAVNSNGTTKIEDTIKDTVNTQTNAIKEQTNAIEEQTQKQEELNDYIMDENVSGNVVLPKNLAKNDNVDGFFSRLATAISNGFRYSDDSFVSMRVTMGGADTYWRSDMTTVILNNFLGGHIDVIKHLISGFWYFLVIWYVYNDIRKEIDKVSNFTFVNDSVDTDIL